MLNNCGEAEEASKITFSDFHPCLPALFSLHVCARGWIRDLTYMRIYLDTALLCDVLVKVKWGGGGDVLPWD